MSDCIFCEIVQGRRQGTIVFQDGQVTAFRDTRAAGPTHILIVPNRHIASVNDLTEPDESLVGHLFTTAARLARQEGIAESGYRLILNTGRDGGQTVFHLHLHLIGGQPMRYPMG